MTSKLAIGLFAITLSSTVGAVEQCSFPQLYATNIRPACEQYGSTGMAGLYGSNKTILGMMKKRAKSAVHAH